MRRFALILLTLSCAMPLLAQEASVSRNIPRGDDRLETVRLMVNYSQTFFSDTTICDLRDTEEAGKSTFLFKDLQGSDSMALITPRGRRYLCLSQDTLYYSGLENNQLSVSFFNPIPLVIFPFNENTEHEGFFQGYGSYCDKLSLSAMGRWRMKTATDQTIITPEGDSLRHVLRVALRLYASLYYSQRSDSLAFKLSLPTDSIQHRLSTEPHPLDAEVIFWLSPGYRYPVLIARTLAFEGAGAPTMDGQAQAELWYCPPDLQTAFLPSDPENEAYRAAIANDTFATADADDFAMQYTIKGGAREGSLHVDYSLPGQSTVEFILTDVRGMVYHSIHQSHPAGEGYTADIPLAGLPRGQYVLYLCCNGKRVAEKFSIL